MIVQSSALASSQALVPKITQNLQSSCPKCTISKTIDIPVADWSTQIQPAVQSALTADSSINIVIPASDTMSLYIVPAIRAANSDAKIVTEGASAAIVHQIPDGVVAGDIGWSNPWVGYASVDQVLRGVAGVPAVESEDIPLVLFDSTNISKLAPDDDPSVYFGNSYLDGYKQLWSGA